MPVVLVSTLFGDVKNVAPYAWHMPISIDPPLLGIAMRKSRDTYRNILEQGEFVVAVPGPDLLARMERTADPLPRDRSEFEHAGLTPSPSKKVKPFHVLECPVNMECSFVWEKGSGDHQVVVGKVLHVEMANGPQDGGRVYDIIYHSMGPGATYLRLDGPL
jgi:flavin reductase (DIM6/NTAB) family NADH-FMN oxidoreductase RutF